MSIPLQGIGGGGGGGGLNPSAFLGAFSGSNPSNSTNGQWWYRVDTGQLFMNVNGTIIPIRGTGKVTVIASNTTIANTDVFNDVIVLPGAALTVYGTVLFHGNVTVLNGATLQSSNPNASSSSTQTNNYNFLGTFYLNGTYSIAQYNVDSINASVTISTVASEGGASPTISGAGTLSIPSGITLTLGVNTTWALSAITGSGTLSVASGYTLTVSANATSSVAAITGSGTLSVSSGYTLTLWAGNTLSISNVSGEIRLVTLITLANNQSQATPTNFQQFISAALKYPSGTYFWNPNDGWLQAWLESLSSSNQANIWVKIPSSIPANGTYQIYMVQDNSKNFDGVYWGEAPQLSSSYAQYDNGGNVFNNYWNFAGTSLPSGWASSTTVTVNNGLSFSEGAVYTTSAVFSSLNNIEEAYYEITSAAGQQFNGLCQSNTDAPAGGNSGANNEILWITSSSALTYYAYSANGTSASYNIQNGVESSFTPSVNTFYIFGTYMTPSGVGEMANYNTYLTASGTFSNTNQYIILGYFEGSSSGTTAINPEFVQWVRVRDYPPNGVMPTTSFTSSETSAANIPSIP